MMNDFKLALYQTLSEVPPHLYCTEENNRGRRMLRVLLLGYGARMDQILNTVLCGGQLPDTELDVTLCTTKPSAAMDGLTNRTPDLKRFLGIAAEFNGPKGRADSGVLGKLSFRELPQDGDSVQALLTEQTRWNYIFVSTGNDEKNLKLAQACAEAAFDHPVCIIYVKKSGTGTICPMSDHVTVKTVGSRVPKEDLEQLENTALNLHFIYSKMANDRADADTIRKEFQEPVNYLSSIEAALHIRSKLAFFGICEATPEEQAKAFDRLMQHKPEVVDSLAAVEHRRWMMQKLLDGYRRENDLTHIFQNGITTGSSRDKWHCCLVSSDPSGKSCLTEEDWNRTSGGFRKGLDELDRLSLRIHDRCKEISEANVGMVDGMLQLLQLHISNLDGTASEIQKEFNRLKFLVLQMHQNKHSAVAMYEQCRRTLRKELEQLPSGISGVACSSLDAIHQGLVPLITCISKRDFKEIDRQMVKCIPFALTHRISPVMMKLWAGKRNEDIYSAWRLEAGTLIYCVPVGTEQELQAFPELRTEMEQFWAEQMASTQIRWCLCLPTCLMGTADEIIGDHSDSVAKLQVEDWTVEGLAAALSPELIRSRTEYVDISGADSMLAQAAYQAAQGQKTGVFYISHGQFRSLYRADELGYLSPDKSMTVREMFRMSGAEMENDENDLGSNFAYKYRSLWDIALKNKAVWNLFCRDIAKVYGDYRKDKRLVFSFKTAAEAVPGEKKEIRLDGLPFSTVEALLPQLRKLERIGSIRAVSAEKEMGGGYRLTVIADSGLADTDALEQFLRRCCSLNPARNHWEIAAKSHRTDMICEGLEVENMPLPDWKRAPEKGKVCLDKALDLLHQLAQCELLLNYSENLKERTCSFEFASVEVQECIQISGTILEYMIYYTCLLEAHFYDAERGVSFRHSAQTESANNEIDIIATKGSKSLWISAKLVNDIDDKFNYFMYEITLMAMQCGVNATPVLAAPALDLFVMRNGKRCFSKYAQKALNRGVCLLGRECFTSGRLGEVLDRIADGRQDWYDILPCEGQ